MMPQLVSVRVRRPGRRTIRVWVPVVLAVLLLSPILLLAMLGAVVACLIYRIPVLPAFAGVWRVIAALPGARFDIEQGRSAFLVSIR
jgi:hypothetical protein